MVILSMALSLCVFSFGCFLSVGNSLVHVAGHIKAKRPVLVRFSVHPWQDETKQV